MNLFPLLQQVFTVRSDNALGSKSHLLFHLPNLPYHDRIELDSCFTVSLERVHMRGNMIVEVYYDLIAFSPEDRRHLSDYNSLTTAATVHPGGDST
jgi:hypothetical protein